MKAMAHRRRLVAAWLALVALALVPAAPMFAQASAAGEWRVNFVVPTGTRSVNMVINQQRATLSGTVINEDGEFPLKGRITDDQVTIVWSVPEAGKLMELTMKGKLSGDTITGTLQLGEVGEGPLSARRTAE
jgi:hypothetical protein